MTMTDPARDTTRDMPATPLTDEEKATAARAEWHASGGTLTGADLARRFGMSARWGQKQRTRARAEAHGPGTAPRAAPVPTLRAEARPPVPPEPAPARTTAPGSPTGKRHAAPAQAGASTAVRRVTALAVAVVAAVAAATSYSHMHELAVMAGESVLVARVLPLSVDGLVVAATMALLAARREGRAGGVLPWCALVLGLGASLAANVAAAEPTVVGRLVAAWPPVALALSFELLLRQARGGDR